MRKNYLVEVEQDGTTQLTCLEHDLTDLKSTILDEEVINEVETTLEDALDMISRDHTETQGDYTTPSLEAQRA